MYLVEGNSRRSWVRGIVEEPIISGDGRIRQAWVRTKTGVVKRATVRLAVLEVRDSNTEPDMDRTRVTGRGIVKDNTAGQAGRTTATR